MRRIRSATIRASRKSGAGVFAAVILAASGMLFGALPQTKKQPAATKTPTRESGGGEGAKPEKLPKGKRPSASDDLYEGPEVAEPATKKPGSATPLSVPATAPAAVQPPAPEPKALASRNADAWPSEYRPAPADLLPNQQDDAKAEAIAAYAEAELFSERGNVDKALKAYKRAASLDPGDPRLAIQVARELLKTNDPTTAIQVLKDSIAASPKEPKTLIYLAKVYADHLNKADLAKQFSEKALEVAPDYFPAWKAMFDIAATDGSGKKTSELMDRALKANSKEPAFWFDLALFLRKNSGVENRKAPSDDDKRRIEAAYKKGLGIDPQNAAGIAQYGDYFVLIRDHKQAIAQYERAQSLRMPAIHPALENLPEKLATALVADGRKADALPILERLVGDFPGRNDLGMMLAEVYDQLGQTEKALDYYQRSLALDLAKPDNHISLAETYLKAKHPDRAVKTMESAREKFPNNPSVTYYLARCLSLAKKNQMALEMFAAAQKEMKGNDELLNETFFFQYGAAAEQAGEFEKAAELLKKSIELRPEIPDAYNYLGYMWADRGEHLEEAGELIKKAVSIEPENPAYLDSLGWWYYKTGKFEEARKELLRANELMGAEEDATVLDHLADALDKLGKRDEALKLWKKALKLDSDIREKVTRKIEDPEKK
jgi:tetratricopeptide (TPR) repeat protein